MWTALLVILNVQTAQAAWPDDFQPRKDMLSLIRQDLESSISLYRGDERRRRYIRICDAKPKPYFPACEFNSWTIKESDRASSEGHHSVLSPMAASLRQTQHVYVNQRISCPACLRVAQCSA